MEQREFWADRVRWYLHRAECADYPGDARAAVDAARLFLRRCLGIVAPWTGWVQWADSGQVTEVCADLRQSLLEAQL